MSSANSEFHVETLCRRALLFLNCPHQSQMVDDEVARPIRRSSPAKAQCINRSSQRIRPFALFALLLIVLSAFLPAAQCATFFYGATEDSDAAEKVLEPEELETADEHTLALAESAAHADAEGEYDETRLSQHELESVYKFCSLLPLLEEAGHVIKNKQARQVCDKLVAMLKPMFRKRNKAIRPRRAMMRQ